MIKLLELLDKVGQEDEDINNDRKVNNTDKYLAKRRKAIAANLKELTAPENARITIAQLMGPDFFLAQKDETKWTDLEIDLFNRIFKMASETGYVPVMKTEGQDHEVAMAVSSLEEIAKAIIELRQQLGNTERNIPGWIQDHIAKAENYIEQAAQGFHELKHNEMNEQLKRLQELAGVIKENDGIENDIEQDLMHGGFEDVEGQIGYLQNIIEFCQNKIAELQANG